MYFPSAIGIPVLPRTPTHVAATTTMTSTTAMSTTPPQNVCYLPPPPPPPLLLPGSLPRQLVFIRQPF
jgi:hypothetical protein